MSDEHNNREQETVQAVQTVPEFMAGAPLRALNLKEREDLAKMVNTPVFRKAWGNVLLSRPSVFGCAAGAETSRLHELRGWELFREAFVHQLRDPVKREKKQAGEWSHVFDEDAKGGDKGIIFNP